MFWSYKIAKRHYLKAIEDKKKKMAKKRRSFDASFISLSSQKSVYMLKSMNTKKSTIGHHIAVT